MIENFKGGIDFKSTLYNEEKEKASIRCIWKDERVATWRGLENARWRVEGGGKARGKCSVIPDSATLSAGLFNTAAYLIALKAG